MSEDSPLVFPCDIPVKVFGRNDAAFRETVRAIMRTHFADLADEQIAERTSRADSYLSLTIVVRAESRAQIDAAYRELTAHDDVMMVL